MDAIEEADMNPDQAEKVMHEFEKEVHLLTTEPRLRAIAKDFVGHYSDLRTTGKAMFVCLNKVTCVRMYNFVQEYWQEEIKALEQKIASTVSDQEQMELSRKLKWMKDTEMCVVISQEQNEIQTFKKWDLDILPHRTKMEKRELDKEFKDSDSNFRVVFVSDNQLAWGDEKYQRHRKIIYELNDAVTNGIIREDYSYLPTVYDTLPSNLMNHLILYRNELFSRLQYRSSRDQLIHCLSFAAFLMSKGIFRA